MGSDNDDVGRINRCKCGTTAKYEIVPETRKAVGYYKCTECTVDLLFKAMDAAPRCACGHSALLHDDKCTVPYCTCKVDSVTLTRNA